MTLSVPEPCSIRPFVFFDPEAEVLASGVPIAALKAFGKIPFNLIHQFTNQSGVIDLSEESFQIVPVLGRLISPFVSSVTQTIATGGVDDA
jgi:hypothetical protein